MAENTILFAIQDAGFKVGMCGHGFRHLCVTAKLTEREVDTLAALHSKTQNH